MLSETPGYIRQLHQMQSLPYSLSLIGLSRKPPFENRGVLRHHSHRRFRPHRCRQRNNIHVTIKIGPKKLKFDKIIRDVQLSTVKTANVGISFFFTQFWDIFQTGFEGRNSKLCQFRVFEPQIMHGSGVEWQSGARCGSKNIRKVYFRTSFGNSNNFLSFWTSKITKSLKITKST